LFFLGLIIFSSFSLCRLGFIIFSWQRHAIPKPMIRKLNFGIAGLTPKKRRLPGKLNTKLLWREIKMKIQELY
jgi:hypothetical protein